MEGASLQTPSPRTPKDPSQMRIYKACLYCRQRKTKCHLDNNKPPCQRCVRENRDCVLGGSNRGRPRKHKTTTTTTKTPVPAPRPGVEPGRSSEASNGDEDDSAFAGLQNPSDALGILAQVADENDESGRGAGLHAQRSSFQQLGSNTVSYVTPPQADAIPYQLCIDGYLTTRKVHELLERYEQKYHPYYPIVPSRVFNPAIINDVAAHEPHLLTAILLISSKDVEDDALVHGACSEYMQRLISGIAIGKKSGVEAVEALLILAEWTPHQQHVDIGSVGRGEEDRAAWMYIGMALRVGYFLGLDLTSFRTRDEPSDAKFLRNRFIWTASYMSDRQISTRVGRAFWSRGPGPWTNLTKGDFPMLQPKSPRDEDYASIFQATIELTQIFTNVHDILYARRGPSLKAVLVADYIKYIDDFRQAIKGWNSVWGTLTCSPRLKATLLISYDYLRLYTNAFALQATFSRKLFSKKSTTAPRPSFASISSNPDARFIFEALDGAKSLLVTVNNFLDPEQSLRYMPLKYYLYIIYSAVFLYKARFLSISNPEETRGVRDMISVTIDRLRLSSSGPQHPGSRYASLLARLWGKGDSRATPPDLDGASRLQPPSNNSSNVGEASSALGAAPVAYNHHPHHHHHQGAGYAAAPAQSAAVPSSYDFNWLDLDAVGQFAMDESHYVGEYMHDTEAMWLGFGMEPPSQGLGGTMGDEEMWTAPMDGTMFF